MSHTAIAMNSPQHRQHSEHHHQHHHHHHHHGHNHNHHHHHDVHSQRLLWFFSFCNQRSSSSSTSSAGSSKSRRNSQNNRASNKQASSGRNKFALLYQQQLSQLQRQSSIVFGRELIEHAQLYSDVDSIPYIVKSCADFIEKHGIIFGIYRLSGMRVNINKLRQDFDKNPKISAIDNEAISNDAHAVACVLKQYFRELPTPLLTFHMYERFIELFRNCNREKVAKDTSGTSNINNNNNNDNNIISSSSSNSDNNNSKSTINANHDKITHTSQSNSAKIEEDPIDFVDDVKDKSQDRIEIHDNSKHISCAATAKPALSTASPVILACTKDITSSTTVSKPITITSIASVTTNTTVTSTTSNVPITKVVQQALTTKSKSTVSNQDNSSTSVIAMSPNRVTGNQKSQFSSSASDSQLISLSSVVTTTTSDVEYQINLDDLKQLLFQLPRAHYQTLRFLMRHLANVASQGQSTGMDSKNVAIVWAPNLLKPRAELLPSFETIQVIALQAVITEQLIKHHKFLFDDEDAKCDSKQENTNVNDDDTDDKDLKQEPIEVETNRKPYNQGVEKYSNPSETHDEQKKPK